jgi:hypothetical protein
MRPSLARYSAPVSFVHAPSLADFITIIVGFKFSVHTTGNISAFCRLVSRPMQSPTPSAQDLGPHHLDESAARPSNGVTSDSVESVRTSPLPPLSRSDLVRWPFATYCGAARSGRERRIAEVEGWAGPAVPVAFDPDRTSGPISTFQVYYTPFLPRRRVVK